uniref:Protein kinase domain-containing protein n=1 Tax=Rhizophagus irregularis (strain DAOM 181602 / DAOM 197198 / MUCL 43194) TaxID=747089 RepID=U9UNR3_RHIID
MQLEIDHPTDIIFEWIPYNQFEDIKEIRKGNLATATWKDGSLYWNSKNKEYLRYSDEIITLKYFDSEEFENERLLNKVLNEYSIKESKISKIYGISQDPITKDYLLILYNNYLKKFCIECGEQYTDINMNWCKPCKVNYLENNNINSTSVNEIIDNFIYTMQLKINEPEDKILEWIPYDQLSDINYIKEIKKDTLATAIWKNGSLYWNSKNKEYIRNSDEIVVLEYFDGEKFYSKRVLSEVLIKYSIKEYSINKIYGISQDSVTKDYILILNIKYLRKFCVNCVEQYTDENILCKINNQREYFITWTSGNEKIDNFIREMLLKIDVYKDIFFEWIPYNQFSDIEKIDQGGFATVYSAMWKDGPFRYYKDKNEWIRDSDKKVALKCLNNSQNITNGFLNEVKAYLIYNPDKILRVYGISQDPDTKNYIMVLQYAEGRNFNYWMNNNSKYFNWLIKLKVLSSIISGLKEIHQKQMVHRDFHIGNILFKEIHLFTSNYISDMGLCGEIGNIDETNIYGVVPYVAPEVLRGKTYTQAADIYSFDICKGIRPEINELEAPKCYIDLMKKCWDSNPINRPNASEIEKFIILFHNSYCKNEIKRDDNDQIEEQFKEAEKYRSTNRNIKSTFHPQAIYTSRLLNSFTKDLPEYIDDYTQCINNRTECLDCAI